MVTNWKPWYVIASPCYLQQSTKRLHHNDEQKMG